MAEPPRFSTVAGTVTAFDDHAGCGTIRTTAGEELFFHCTQIADGSRCVAVGTSVTARVEPLGVGGWEAAEITAATPT